MDCDDILENNFHWTLLGLDWDPTVIDLDESIAPPKTPYSKHSNFYKDSIVNICESPFGIDMFRNVVSYAKFYDEISSYPLSSSCENIHSCQNKESTDYVQRSKISANEHDNVANSAETQIDNDYESIKEYQCMFDPKKLTVDPVVVEHSVTMSDLSFDDTIISPENKNNAMNQTASTLENNINENTQKNISRHSDDLKTFRQTLSENYPPPAETVESSVSENSVSSCKICNNKLNLNNAIIINSSSDSKFNTSDTLSDYYAFVLGAIHKNSSDFPSKNVHNFNATLSSISSASSFANNTSISPYVQIQYLYRQNDKIILFPPENDLQKNSADRVLSEHQLRVQRSLQKLNLPEWYKNSPARPEGFLLKKRASDAGTNNRGWESAGLGSKTTSLGSLGGGGGVPLARSPLALTPPSQQLAFSRWSTSRLNSTQTSPCSSARSSIRGGAVSPLTSPARPPRAPRPTRAPYLGWRSQERLASPRTPHERLAVSLLPQSPPVPANVSDEIQSSIKEVTSAIVHYVSGLEPSQDRLNVDSDVRSTSPRGSPRLCWLESSFVGTKPLESPQTPVVVALSPPHQTQQQQQRPLQLDLPSSRPAANGTVTLSTTTYQHAEE